MVWAEAYLADSLKFSYRDGVVSCVCTTHLKSHTQTGGGAGGKPHDM